MATTAVLSVSQPFGVLAAGIARARLFGNNNNTATAIGDSYAGAYGDHQTVTVSNGETK